MCPIDTDFKHIRVMKAEEFQFPRNDLSIMRAKLLSIMRANVCPVTMG
jgi:hypothetical protein